MSGPIQLQHEDGVACLRLADSRNRNALSAEIKQQLETLVPSLVDDPTVRCILITGEERVFCAGGDVRSLGGRQSPTAVRRRMAASYSWIDRLLSGETPVVTAVNGAAVGAGFGLAMLGDIIFAADDAWFMGGFGTIGVAADYCLGRTLPRAIGTPRAKDILLTGRRVEAAEAAAIGMVSRVVSASALMEEAWGVSKSLASGPSVALGLTKKLIDSAHEGSVMNYLEREGFAQSCAFSTEDHHNAVEAFLARRTPSFEGR